jgi:hypothetical protein
VRQEACRHGAQWFDLVDFQTAEGSKDDAPRPDRYCTSRRIRWSHTARNLSTALALNDSDVVLALQIKPELGTISKISTESDGCITSDRPASIEYVRDGP